MGKCKCGPTLDPVRQNAKLIGRLWWWECKHGRLWVWHAPLACWIETQSAEKTQKELQKA